MRELPSEGNWKKAKAGKSQDEQQESEMDQIREMKWIQLRSRQRRVRKQLSPWPFCNGDGRVGFFFKKKYYKNILCQIYCAQLTDGREIVRWGSCLFQ